MIERFSCLNNYLLRFGMGMKKMEHILRIDKAQNSQLTLLLDKSNEKVAAQISRILMSQLSTLAINDITVITNTSTWPDEIIVHRLGLVPLRCSSWQPANGELAINLQLDVAFPEDYNDMYINVTSDDLKTDSDYYEPVYHGPDDDPIIIVRLRAGQNLKLSCRATLGTGSLHSKWSDISGLTWHGLDRKGSYVFTMEINGALTPEEIVEAVKAQLITNGS